jgi:hypothetical protein
MPKRQSIPESLADVSVQQKLAKARQRTRVSLAKKLKVSEETVRRTQRRIDLYLSTLGDYMERRGGSFRLEALFPGQPPVFLSGLGGDGSGKKAKKKTAAGAKSKPKSGRATSAIRDVGIRRQRGR